MPALRTEVHDALDPRHRGPVGEIDCVGAPTQQETPEYRAPGIRDPGAWISSPMCSILEIDAYRSRHDRARELGQGSSPVGPITTNSRSRCSIRWIRGWIPGCDPARTKIPRAREQLRGGDVVLPRAWEPGPMCSGPEHGVLAPRDESLGMSPGSLSMSTHPSRDPSCTQRRSASRALRTKDKSASMAHDEAATKDITCSMRRMKPFPRESRVLRSSHQARDTRDPSTRESTPKHARARWIAQGMRWSTTFIRGPTRSHHPPRACPSRGGRGDPARGRPLPGWIVDVVPTLRPLPPSAPLNGSAHPRPRNPAQKPSVGPASSASCDVPIPYQAG
jgi:hypothetical protein